VLESAAIAQEAIVLNKPFSTEALAGKIRDVLEGPRKTDQERSMRAKV
jgi:hypothetical protein